MKTAAIIMTSLVVMISPSSFGEDKPCGEAEYVQLAEYASSLRDWDALYRSYLRYWRCQALEPGVDDVDADEGYSESEERILTDHWETLPRLAQLIKKDKSFGKFVGPDAVMDMKDVAKIRENAINHCPAGLASLCSKLRNDADEAMAENAVVMKQNQ
jgi:hypothetical protein